MKKIQEWVYMAILEQMSMGEYQEFIMDAMRDADISDIEIEGFLDDAGLLIKAVAKRYEKIIRKEISHL